MVGIGQAVCYLKTPHMKKILSLLASLLVLVSTSYADSSQTISIGGIFDLSGGGAIWGVSERNAFSLAVKDFEARNPGTTARTFIEDSQFSNKQTITALQKLISVDKVSYVVGATWETTVPMLPVCEARKVVCISPSYHGKEYYQRPWRYNFTAWFDDRSYTTAIAEAMNEKEYKNIVVYAAITPYYDALVENFLKLSKVKPLQVERMILDERDFRSTISSGPANVDAIVMLLDNAGQIQAFMKQWSELRKDRPDIYSDDLIVFLDPPEDVKRHGFHITYGYPVFDEGVLQEFTKRYEDTFHEKPQASSASVTYDETMLILQCAQKDPSAESVRSCVAATKDYRGYSGFFSFNGSQTVQGRVVRVKPL